MAKATPLTPDLMAPGAAPAPLAPRPLASKPVEKGEGKAEKLTPLQVRWPPDEVKAMKRAALDADMTYSQYLLSCFHAYKKA
jgi:hypothetical protein